MAEEVIAGIRVKCEEIKRLVDFIVSRAGIGDETWERYDDNYLALRGILKAASTDLITLSQQLESSIP